MQARAFFLKTLHPLCSHNFALLSAAKLSRISNLPIGNIKGAK